MEKPVFAFDQSKSFVNPYNFVPVMKPRQDINGEVKAEKLHYGVIKCTLINRTPLAIPDPFRKKVDNNGHASFNFMSMEGNKVIPGSSIRGVLRSVYETVTDSCMSTVRNGVLTTRGDSRHAYMPGLLVRENDQWNLYAARRIAWVINKDAYGFSREGITSFINEGSGKPNSIVIDGEPYYWGDKVWFTKGGSYKSQRHNNRTVWDSTVRTIAHKPSVNDKDDESIGWVYIGEKIRNKHAESVFIFDPDEKEPVKANVGKEIAGLKRTLAEYRDDAINRNLGTKPEDHHGYKGFEDAESKGTIPIWYLIDNGLLYLSAAAIGRKAYVNTVADLAGKPCTNRNKLCKACSLFGMIGQDEKVQDDFEGVEKSGKSYGSRVRVTDAVCMDDKGTENVTLKELGSPRAAYLPFYSAGGKSYDADGAQIRGRKFYWHDPRAASDKSVYSISSQEDKTKRNATMELLKPESEFKFSVYYDGVTKEQLEEFKWLLTLGENTDDSDRCFKIGHGKPLGLGSVKITIDTVEERVFDSETFSYRIKSASVQPQRMDVPSGMDKASVDQFLMIADYSALSGKDMRYPFITVGDGIKVQKSNDDASHQWFLHFREDGRRLPDINAVSKRNEMLHPYKITAYEDNINNNVTRNSRKFSYEGNKNRKRSNDHNTFHQPEKEEKKSEPVLEGTVCDYNQKKTSVKVRLADGTIVPVYYRNLVRKCEMGMVDEKYKQGEEISIQYIGTQTGKDGRQYKQYREVAKNR